MLKSNRKSFLLYFSFFLILFVLDQLTKKYIIYLDRNSFDKQLFSSLYLNIKLVWNQGIAFGLFSLDEGNYYNLLSVLISIVILIIVIMIFKEKGFKRFSLVLIVSGATGNFYDRIVYSAVPDFIDLHVGDYHWFIFNVADIFITIGVIIIIFLEIFDNIFKN